MSDQNAVRVAGGVLPVAPWEAVHELAVSGTQTRYGPFTPGVYLVSLRVFGAVTGYWKAGDVTVEAVADLADSIAIVEADGWVDIVLHSGRRYISVIGDGAATGQIVERAAVVWPV